MPATVIILARAGSKGVPGKNVTDLADRPCLEWTILDAQAARTVGPIAVSTDDPRATRIAGEFEGVRVIERPADLAGDLATVDAAARHAHQQLGSPEGPVVILYANVPLRPAGLIDRAVRLLEERSADSVQSYAPVGKHHPWWTARVNEATGEVQPWEGDVLNHGVYRRQDLPQAFLPDGGVLVVSPAALHLQIELPEAERAGPHAFFGASRLGVQTAEGEVIDIDTPIDVRVADAALREREAQRAAEQLHASGGRAGWRRAHRQS
ncbi:MAG: CMP-N,N'-diacetyllegionaminic acid synthase [Phycisphaerales bacterium]|jgi:CMP-N,N'-diacetyllegionaminic acid synthase